MDASTSVDQSILYVRPVGLVVGVLARGEGGDLKFKVSAAINEAP